MTSTAMNGDGFESAEALDAKDELGCFRKHFSLIENGETIYLCSQSLGLMPCEAREAVNQHLNKWAEKGVQGHFEAPHKWFRMEDEASALSLDLVGAKKGEIVYMNGLSVNLHLMLSTFYRPSQNGKYQIMIEEKAFSSDDYVVQTHLVHRGIDPGKGIIRLAPRDGEYLLREGDIISSIRNSRETLALIMLPGVQYYTGQVLPMESICRVAHECNVIVGWDLAHAVGNIELRLHDWGVDFACWCSYKYLCGGPGAVSGVFIHERHGKNTNLPRLGGWWGQKRKNRLEMAKEFDPQEGAYGFQLSNLPVLSLAPVGAALEIYMRAGMRRVRAKGKRMSEFLQHLLRKEIGDQIELISPAAAEERGCQLSLKFQEGISAKAVKQFLKRNGVICDYRHPDVMRVAPHPLYTTFEDLSKFVTSLKYTLDTHQSH